MRNNTDAYGHELPPPKWHAERDWLNEKCITGHVMEEHDGTDSKGDDSELHSDGDDSDC